MSVPAAGRSGASPARPRRRRAGSAPGARSRPRSRARRKRNEFMFFSSVFVPSVALPAGRIDTLASTRSEPSSMFTSETPIWRSVAWSRRPNSPASRRRAEVGLGHDLDQRRAAAVEVDDAGLGAVDAARARPRATSLAASSSRCTRWMRTSPRRPAGGKRDVVLADLVALRQVGIEVVLAVEDRPRRDLAAERQRDHQPEVHRLARSSPAACPGGRGRPGRCACSARRRTTARSRRTSSCASSAGRGSRGR